MALASAQACTIQISIPEKIMGYPKQSLEKKNLFVKKYDEIRRLDGTFSSETERRNGVVTSRGFCCVDPIIKPGGEY